MFDMIAHDNTCQKKTTAQVLRLACKWYDIDISNDDDDDDENNDKIQWLPAYRYRPISRKSLMFAYVCLSVHDIGTRTLGKEDKATWPSRFWKLSHY